MTTRAAADVEIVYPETDGMPLPDGEYQAPIYRKIVLRLEVHFRDVPGARVNGNTFIYYVEGDPRRSVSPDCYVVFGLTEESLESIRRRNTYLIWEVGKAPEFVLEIGSSSTATTDLGRKRDLYAGLGMLEYWRHDASGGDFYGEPLVGERLVDGEYRRLEMHHESDGRVWSHSEALNLELWWVEGDLHFRDPVSGSWLPSHEDEIERRREAEARADQEQARADREQARADQERAARREAEARLAELMAELRRRDGE